MEYLVYRVSGAVNNHNYYGYCTHDGSNELSCCQQSFVTHATRKEEDRADVRFIEENTTGDEPAKLTYAVISRHTDEVDAFCTRNLYRAKDVMSFTGPTSWPLAISTRANSSRKELVSRVSATLKAKNSKTAREAWSKGLWNNDDVRQLTSTHDKQQVIVDLDHLTPEQFHIKYFQHSS
jgi:hypothetical protein